MGVLKIARTKKASEGGSASTGGSGIDAKNAAARRSANTGGGGVNREDCLIPPAR